MIDVGRLDLIIADAGGNEVRLAPEAMRDIANELRLGNAARLMLRANADIAGVCAALDGAGYSAGIVAAAVGSIAR